MFQPVEKSVFVGSGDGSIYSREKRRMDVSKWGLIIVHIKNSANVC